MLPEQISHENVLRVLTAGFAAVILLLMTAGFIGVGNLQSIRQNSASLVEQQSVTNRLIDEMQRQQVSLTEVFSALARDPDSIDDAKLRWQLDQADQNIGRIAQAGGQTAQKGLWSQLQEAASAFSGEARRLLSVENPASFSSLDLFRLHEDVVSIMARLIGTSYRKVTAAQDRINQLSQQMVNESLLLLGACLLAALVSGFFTVRTATQLFRKMEWQTAELSRVSWHMLENQETTARRFSHELHDELGQALTAIKANLAALQSSSGFEARRLEDCQHLVDEAIGNVRQMSQLLRPTILDDFGLEAGLRWLCEGFTKRTGIEVEFQCEFHGRLPDEFETHLYRIAQEALTNVARHSGAGRVWVTLDSRENEVRLSIADDGRGLPAPEERRPEGLGLIGMRARARSAGGDIIVRSHNGRGVMVEVRVPAKSIENQRNDSHLVG